MVTKECSASTTVIGQKLEPCNKGTWRKNMLKARGGQMEEKGGGSNGGGGIEKKV